MNNDINVELLSPAGNFEKLKFALLYGADSVYIGSNFSLRKNSTFSISELKEALEYTHNLNKKLYVAVNMIPHDHHLLDFEIFLKEIKYLDIDALIVSDLGIFNLTRKILPDIPIHISTQANSVNSESVKFFKNIGASRVILARELSLLEISKIHENVPDIELEVFVHGSMCVSVSGRCLLSNYMTNRDANLGDCSQPCRFTYDLIEAKRPNESFNIKEIGSNTFIMNSKDLSTISFLPSIIKSGVVSLKIEGRAKSEYYVACVTKTYREYIEKLKEGNCSFDKNWEKELSKVSHRSYSPGFYLGGFGHQNYETSSYIRNYDFLGVVYENDGEYINVLVKNRFFKGEQIEIISPNIKGFNEAKILEIIDDTKIIEVANKPGVVVKILINIKVPKYSLIRKKLFN